MAEDRLIKTQRLLLRPLERGDAGVIYLLFTDEETIRYWNTFPHQSVQETVDMIDHIISRERSFYWAICLPEDDTAIGYVGYVGNPGTPGLVYLLAPDFRGQGLAAEAIRAAVGYGFDNLKLKRMEAWIHPENIDSIKAAGRVGFTFRGRRRIKFVNASVPHDLLVYGLKASEWFHVAGALASKERDQNFYALRPVLPVKDIEETVTFYRDKLGFELEYCHGDPPIAAGVSKGEWSPEAVQIRFIISEEETRPSGYLYIVVGADIDGLYESYRQQGVKFDFELRKAARGGREFQISDLNGHKLRYGTL